MGNISLLTILLTLISWYIIWWVNENYEVNALLNKNKIQVICLTKPHLLNYLKFFKTLWLLINSITFHKTKKYAVQTLSIQMSNTSDVASFLLIANCIIYVIASIFFIFHRTQLYERHIGLFNKD